MRRGTIFAPVNLSHSPLRVICISFMKTTIARLLMEKRLATQSQLAYLRRTVNEPNPDTNAEPIFHPPSLYPLSDVRAGVSVRIKRVSASPEITSRLREMGFCEDQKIRLISRQSNLICQVCHARLGISSQLAEKILVEPLTGQQAA